MRQFKTTIRLSWDDLDLLTAYQTAKDIPIRTEAIMEAVKEACAREKITVAILPETMRASYYLAAENLAVKTPIKDEGTDTDQEDFDKLDVYKEDDQKRWLCNLDGKQKTIADCRACPTPCRGMKGWHPKEIITEKERRRLEREKQMLEKEEAETIKTVEKLAKEGLSFEEIAEKIDWDEGDLKELVKCHDITIEAPKKERTHKKEPVTPTQATQKPIVVSEHKETEAQKEEPKEETATPPYRSLVIHETQTAPKPTPEKRPATLRMGASEPQEPSVVKEAPKDQPPETVGDPDPVVQQAAYIRTLREKSEKKPKTRGQQRLGDEGP